jgi:hypothetical protein
VSSTDGHGSEKGRKILELRAPGSVVGRNPVDHYHAMPCASLLVSQVDLSYMRTLQSGEARLLEIFDVI